MPTEQNAHRGRSYLGLVHYMEHTLDHYFPNTDKHRDMPVPECTMNVTIASCLASNDSFLWIANKQKKQFLVGSTGFSGLRHTHLKVPCLQHSCLNETDES